MHDRSTAGLDVAAARQRRTPRWGRWLYVSSIVIVLDQITKFAILHHFQQGEQLVLAPFFNLVLAFNTGAAFSMLNDAGGWQRGFFMAVALVASGVIIHLLRRHASEPRFCFALALVLGGAVGNLIDRITLGKVVDFLLVHWHDWYFPAFNTADSAITVGAVLLIWDNFRRPHEQHGV